jgi:hypothetical protein
MKNKKLKVTLAIALFFMNAILLYNCIFTSDKKEASIFNDQVHHDKSNNIFLDSIRSCFQYNDSIKFYPLYKRIRIETTTSIKLDSIQLYAIGAYYHDKYIDLYGRIHIFYYYNNSCYATTHCEPDVNVVILPQ